MIGKQSSLKTPKNSKTARTPKTPRAKKMGGGTAVGGGVNFQAAATAIVGVHILRGTALNWLEGLCSDKPTAVWAESEGPGDDLRIELANNSPIEVQAKKGLVRGANLWAALHSIADAIHSGQFLHGVLAVASDSSRTIREDLAIDIERLGQGRTDVLTDIGADWAQRLHKANIPVQQVCRCMRIKVIHARSSDDTSISAAKEVLRYICARDEDVDAAWNCLYRQAVLLIEKRGRWTLQDLIRQLRSENIAIREDDFPASVLDRYSKWVINTNNHFFITGIRRKIPLASLLPMRLGKMEFTQMPSDSASSALERYHRSTGGMRLGQEFDAIWTARFKMLAVVVAGPGLGKSTMLKELAHQYAQDGYLVLSVALKPIAAAMQHGATFSELLLSHALDGSPLSPNQIRGAASSNWIILADGLDECGSAHSDVAEQINRFASGHPLVRVVVTTRPIGYETAELSSWTHYSLLPPRKEDGAENLEKLVRSVLAGETSHPSVPNPSHYQLGQIPPSDAISSSPQLLGMSASLIYHRRALPSTRLGLYTELLSLFEKLPAASSTEQADLYETVLNIIGWNVLSNPLMFFDDLIDCTAITLAPLMGTVPLALKKDVRLAVAHWERVGLVEKVFHDGTALLTFIHKTFCEFVASRFLVSYPKGLIQDVVDYPDKQEVINFAAGQGLADDLIDFYLSRFAAGRPQQLQPALALLGKQGILVSDRWAQELIRQSFKAIEDGVSEKFSIGIALSDIGERAHNLIWSLAASKLETDNSTIKLVAWAIVARCDLSSYSAEALSAALAELLTTVEPVDIRDILEKKDRGDRDLLQFVALAALKAQPDDYARSFADQLLRNKQLQTVGFIFKINHILKSRDIVELSSPLSANEDVRSSVTLVPVGPTWRDGSLRAYRSIANAFVNYNAKADIVQWHNSSLVQFAGLMRASGLMEVPVSDFYSWLDAHDEAAVHSTMRAVALLTPLDLRALAEDARDILHRLDKDLRDSILTILPAVDVDPPTWEKAPLVLVNRDEIMRGLVHSSSWINFLAMNICAHFPMSRDKLEELLHMANGYSIHCVIVLIQQKHYEVTTQMLLQRINRDSSGDVSGVFKALRELDAPPSPQLMSTTLTCLCSSDSNTAQSASEFLIHWFDLGIVIDDGAVAKAVEHWGGRDSWIHNSLSNTPVLSLNELLDKIKALQ